MDDDLVIDSAMSDAEALAQNPALVCPDDVLAMQAVIPVRYPSFDGKIHAGQIVLDRRLVGDIEAVFAAIVREGFPVLSAIPVSDLRIGYSDDVSMDINNTSAFNYRAVTGGAKLSAHALGQAIDINPRLNPYISRAGVVSPPGAVRDAAKPGTILEDSFLVKLFDSLGWEWGGRWKDRIDWHHFEKRL